MECWRMSMTLNRRVGVDPVACDHDQRGKGIELAVKEEEAQTVTSWAAGII